MYTVIKRLEVSAAHSLNLSYRSKCENLHGHNWIITVYCRSAELNADGMVVDFSLIKKAVKERLDHRNLNEVLPFNPTAENIARWVCEQVPHCFKVEVQESESNTAVYHTGTPAVFVRFSGCNLKCGFCDTRHEEGVMMTDEEIIAEVKKYPAVMVILTGGEPSLWIDDHLIGLLHQAGKYVCIETNGTRPLPAAIDWITCSPKQGVKLGLNRMDEVKVVYEGQNIDVYELLPAEHFFLQPCSCNNTAATVDCVMRHPKWRLSLQTHKLINIL